MRLSALHNADFLPLIHLHWQLNEQFNVQSTQLTVLITMKIVKTENVNKNKGKIKEKGKRENQILKINISFQQQSIQTEYLIYYINLILEYSLYRKIKYKKQLP